MPDGTVYLCESRQRARIAHSAHSVVIGAADVSTLKNCLGGLHPVCWEPPGGGADAAAGVGPRGGPRRQAARLPAPQVRAHSPGPRAAVGNHAAAERVPGEAAAGWGRTSESGGHVSAGSLASEHTFQTSLHGMSNM